MATRVIPITGSRRILLESEQAARKLLEALPKALDEQGRAMPPGRIDADAAVEIQKLRGVAEIAEARGEGALRAAARRLDWTVILDRDLELTPSPLHRTLRLVPFRKAVDVLEQLAVLRGYIQTVGLAAGED